MSGVAFRSGLPPSAALALGLLFAFSLPVAAKAATVATTTISSDTEWTTADSPVEILSPVTINSGSTLTIDPGVIVKIATSTVGSSAIVVNGVLNVGSASSNTETVFTSLADDTEGGDTNLDGASSTPSSSLWTSISFLGTATSSLYHARFRYGGSSTDTNNQVLLSVEGSPVLIQNSTFEGVPGDYVFIGAMANLDLEQDTFGASQYLTRFSTPTTDATSTVFTMHESAVTAPTLAVIDYRQGFFLTHIEDNYWGSATGPASLGYSDPAFVFYTPFWTCNQLADSRCALPKISSVLFLPGTEGSRLYYKDSLGVEHRVWEPDFHTDIPYLAMNADGTSVYDLYTKDIVDKIYGDEPLVYAAALAASQGDTSNLEMYSGLESYLNTLAASTTVNFGGWEAYPYDWRYDVFDVLNNGTETKQTDGTISRVYLTSVLEQMAASSPTGKVTVIGHSNGGLLAKALAESLGSSAATYIDQIILVGSPQWGTPEAIGAALHADNFAAVPSLVIRGTDARSAMTNMGDAYDLLPSSAYFSHVSDPVVTFEPTGSLSGAFATKLGAALTTLSGLQSFLTDAFSLDSSVGDSSDTHAPIPLNSTLLAKAATTHSLLDSWTPPSGITVTAIAGWGNDTPEGLAYSTASKPVCQSTGIFDNACADAATLRHVPILTQDGDGTVVSTSAIADTTNTFFFNIKDFENNNTGIMRHQNLTSAPSIQNLLLDLLKGVSSISESYISTSTPSAATSSATVISSHSPVDLSVTDSSGNVSGVIPVSGTDFAVLENGISGSSVQVSGEETYIYVPSSGTYQVSATGYSTGAATIEIGSLNSDGSIATTQTYSDMPVEDGSKIALSYDATTNSASAATLDEEGDGTTDSTLDLGTATSTEFIAPLKVQSEARAAGGPAYAPYPGVPSILATTTALLASTSAAIASTTDALLSTTTPFIGTTTASSTLLFRPVTIKQVPTPQLARRTINVAPSTTPSSTPIEQTAAVYNALSQSVASRLMGAMYHLFNSSWRFIASLVP